MALLPRTWKKYCLTWLELVNKLSNGKALTSTETTSVSDAVTSVKVSSASLDQNIPNPLTKNTIIRYNLPEGTGNAQMIITDNNGHVIRKVQLDKGSAGTVNIDASSLSSGTYNYALIADGKIIDSMKMVVAR